MHAYGASKTSPHGGAVMGAPLDWPTHDKWGILNWARDSNRALWDVAPCARVAMLRDAAVRRWRAHYQTTDILAWLDYADWLHANLAEITTGCEGWDPK